MSKKKAKRETRKDKAFRLMDEMVEFAEVLRPLDRVHIWQHMGHRAIGRLKIEADEVLE